MNTIKYDDDHDTCQEIIVYLQNIIYAQSCQAKKDKL